MKLPWNRQQDELEREVAYHLETMADALEQQGMSRAEALREARRQFGGVEQVKEECRAESRWAWLEQARQDIRFSWRMMKKTPSISVAAIVSLGLGIGATTAIWSMADAILWREMAVPAPEQMLQVLWESNGRLDSKIVDWTAGGGFRDGALDVGDFFSKAAIRAMQERSAGKLELAAHLYPDAVSVSWNGNVATTRLRPVGENFFEVLRLEAALGQTFEKGSREWQLVVSHAFWQRHLGGQRDAVGKTIRVNNLPYVLAGVLPRSFLGLAAGDETALYCRIEQSPGFVTPDSWHRPRADDPRGWWMQAVARRNPGVPLSEARAALDAAFAGTWVAKPAAGQTPRIRLSDARTGLGAPRREMGNPTRILLVLVAMVLLVACANIANLLLARGAQREKEVALRVSVGCDAGRLMRQFLTESLVMAMAGGCLSLGVAMVVSRMLVTLLPPNVNPASLQVELSAASLLVTAAITALTAMLFGLYPAWRATRVNVGPALKEGTGSAGTSSRGRWLPAKALVLTQVAIGVLLVTAAIVYTSHLRELTSRDAGFERAHAMLFDVRPGELGFEGERLANFYRSLEQRLRAVPGVTGVGISRIRPMRGGGFHDAVWKPGATERVNSAIHHANAGFVEALGVPLLAGRAFTAEEVKAQRRVLVVSEQLARDLKLGQPLGARVRAMNEDWEVIGVARNARYSRLTETRPVAYMPMPQDLRAATVLVRSSVSPMALTGGIREAVRATSPDVPLVDLFTMEQQIARTLQRERMFAWLCGSFGVLALVLCVVGIYGLMSHMTARRTAEVGIRLALGASRTDVTRQVIGEGMRLAAGGLLLGVPIAVYMATAAQKMRILPEGPMPYWTLVAAIAVLVVSALAAVAGPAVRASSVDPMRALREN